jgi:hypothetical protein
MEWAKAAFLLKEMRLLIYRTYFGTRILLDQLPTALAVGNLEFVTIIGFSQNIYHSSSQIPISRNLIKKLMAFHLINFG